MMNYAVYATRLDDENVRDAQDGRAYVATRERDTAPILTRPRKRGRMWK